MEANAMMQLSLDDACRGNAESTAAYAVTPSGADRQMVYALIVAAGSYGITVDELSVRLDRTPNSLSGRVTELREQGAICKVGTRKTRAGCSAAVWAVTGPR